MTPGPERQLITDLTRALRGTFLEGELILGGSSGLFGFATQVPAFTEDLDFMIREDLVVARGREIVDILAAEGYRRQPETPTFMAPGRPGFDLVGYSTSEFTDHLSPPGVLQVMVFGDLGIILGEPASAHRDSSGGVALTREGFCAVKLLTIRVEKGVKDKLQALLVISEQGGRDDFRENLQKILFRFDRERRTDVLADAQSAFISLQRDPEFQDHGAEGYASFLSRAEAGFQALAELLGVAHG